MFYKIFMDEIFTKPALNKVKHYYNQVILESRSILMELKQGSSDFDNIFSIVNKIDDLKEIESIASKIRKKFNKVIVLGTGGSSLNGQIFTTISDNKVDIKFLENIDPCSVDSILKNLNPTKTAVLCVSKSGVTPETLSNLLIFINHFKLNYNDDISEHFFIITEDNFNPLREIANNINATILDHSNICGRFSTFSNVGLLPAALAGLDIKSIRYGAKKVFEEDGLVIAQSASLNFACMQSGFNINVFMTYVDRLNPFIRWCCQIWSESIGKTIKASTPIQAFGTMDQHSQLQLYLDGPKDKLFTIITEDDVSLNGKEIIFYKKLNNKIEHIIGKRLGAVMLAEQLSTIESLLKRQVPLRQIIVQNVNEEVLGGMAMHFMLETLIVAKLMGINPINQPAIERVKIRTKELLEQNN